MLDLNGQVVVVTGGAGRIGSAFINAVTEHNGVGVIADVDLNRAEAIKQSITQKSINANVECMELDIDSSTSVADLITQLHDRYGKIDSVVNNAYPRNPGFGKNFFEIDVDDFNAFLCCHLGGYFNISQQFVRYFLRQGHGHIINISSIQGVGAPEFRTYAGTDMHSPVEYTVAKHGVIGMTKYMAKMFINDGIRVNAISPGGIRDSQPERFLAQYKQECGKKGMLDASDLAGSLLYLLSDGSRYVTGQNLIVDDGFCL